MINRYEPIILEPHACDADIHVRICRTLRVLRCNKIKFGLSFAHASSSFGISVFFFGHSSLTSSIPQAQQFSCSDGQEEEQTSQCQLQLFWSVAPIVSDMLIMMRWRASLSYNLLDLFLHASLAKEARCVS